MKKVILVILIVVGLTAACGRPAEKVAGTPPGTPPVNPAATATAPAGAVAEVKVGSMMPAYSAKWLDGSDFDLQSKKGQVVFLNLWATWCGPCRYEIPELNKLHAKYAKRGFSVIGVSVDESGATAVNEFLKEQKIDYPIAIDTDGRLATVFQTSVLPTSVIVDRTGRIVWKHFGLVDTGDQKMLESLEKAAGS